MWYVGGCEEYAKERGVLLEVVNDSVERNEWNVMRANVDHGICFLLGPAKMRKMCVKEETNVFLLENVQL